MIRYIYIHVYIYIYEGFLKLEYPKKSFINRNFQLKPSICTYLVISAYSYINIAMLNTHTHRHGNDEPTVQRDIAKLVHPVHSGMAHKKSHGRITSEMWCGLWGYLVLEPHVFCKLHN
jgi:hypothetical protein